jgi:hypothetical protein
MHRAQGGAERDESLISADRLGALAIQFVGTNPSGPSSHVPEVPMDRETKLEFLIVILSATSAIPLATAVVLALSY